MSFCPTNDIHSVYLDGELPEQFKDEYESHIKDCPKCMAELNKLKALKSILVSDSKANSPDSHYLDESYERLLVKMSYKKNTKHQRPEIDIKSISYAVMAAAAVLAFAFIVPLRSSNKKSVYVPNPAISSITQSVSSYGTNVNNVSLNSGRSIVISGNIEGAVKPSAGYGTSSVSYGPHGGPYGYHNHHNKSMMADVEMFRPEFEDSTAISIKITIPGMGDGPISPNMPFPEIVITGK